MHQPARMPLGIKIIIGFHLLSIVLWTIGQGGAVIAYDTVAKWGLQDPRESLDPVIVEVNRGTGFTDFIIQIPLFILAIIGLWRLKFFGAVISWLLLGMTIYWPVIAWSHNYFFARAGVKHHPFGIVTNLIITFIIIFAIWASWYLFRNRKLFE